MTFTDSYAKIIIDTFPNFSNSDTWQKHLIFWEDDNPTDIYRVSEALKQYLVDEVLSNSSNAHIKEAKQIFNFIENSISQYENCEDESSEKHFANALKTVVLESLINHAGHGDIKYDSFIPLLGVKSREFCKEWDRFTGVRSSGLWEDNEWELSVK